MSEAIRQLRTHTQRALAAAHVIDQQLESPASARVIAAGRAFLESVLGLAEEQTPAPVSAERPVPALPPAPVEVIDIGDEVAWLVDGKFERQGRVVSEYTNTEHGREFFVRWKFGTVRVLATKCRRVR